MIMPSVPSEPINKSFRSYPVLSFRSGVSRFITRPPISTTSIPRHKFLVVPYLTTFNPPAFVARFPPIVQLPFAARFSGKYRFFASVIVWICSRIQPASAVMDRLTSDISLTVFILAVDRIKALPDLSGMPPPTSPVLPPWVTIIWFWASAWASI